MKKILKISTAAAVLGVMLAPQAVMAAPAPILHNDNATYKFGDWYHGAIPPNVDYNKPVILFVQGLHSDYTTWYNTSDGFYDAAYNAGYRTAFVQLKDADGDGGNMWTNGPVLANVIQKVKNYYGVSKINIVAHSKGGIDTQTALVHYGAYPYVNVVHQLSTPNKGSEIADMAYSSWTWWLAAIMGQRDDAVYSLQTSYMNNFRSQTDGRVENNYTRTYMSGGTGDDGFFSATYYSRGFLPGEDDGAVAIYSAFGLPNGYYGFTDNGSERLSHTKMRYAGKTWWQVRPRLTTTSYYGAVAPTTLASTDLVAPAAVEESSNYILRGGQIAGTATDSFTLESGLNGINVDLMTASKATKVTLVSPSGKTYTGTATGGSADDIAFANAAHNVFSIDKPEAGTWTVNMEGANDAYFLNAVLDGGSKAKVKANKKVHSKQDSTVSLALNLEGAKVDGKQLKSAKLNKAEKYGTTSKKSDVELKADNKGGATATFVKPTEAGVYNLSFDVVGTNDKGETVTRSVNYNFAVTDEAGNLPK